MIMAPHECNAFLERIGKKNSLITLDIPQRPQYN